ncbi:MAG: hypothetical protein ACYTET_04795 [Planctomycetota bacterium]
MNASFETICTRIASMSKAEVLKKLLYFDGPLKLDFTEEYLESQTADKLRHILLSAVITVEQKRAG